jgi:hypothetical protein
MTSVVLVVATSSAGGSSATSAHEFEHYSNNEKILDYIDRSGKVFKTALG